MKVYVNLTNAKASDCHALQLLLTKSGVGVTVWCGVGQHMKRHSPIAYQQYEAGAGAAKEATACVKQHITSRADVTL